MVELNVQGPDGESRKVSTKAEAAQVSRENDVNSFVDNVVNRPESVRPTNPNDPILSNYTPPQGAVLPHVRHHEYLSEVATELGSRMGVDLAYKSARDALATANTALLNHAQAHEAGNAGKAYIHLRNAADALHDSILHFRRAKITREDGEIRGSELLKDSNSLGLGDTEEGTPISLEKLQRTKKDPSLGIFDKLAAVVNDYSRQTNQDETTTYAGTGFATEIDPRGRIKNAITSPVIKQPKELPPTQRRKPVIVSSGEVKDAPASKIDPIPQISNVPLAPQGMSQEDHEKARVRAYKHWMDNDESIQLMGGVKELTRTQRDRMFETSDAANDPHKYLATAARLSRIKNRSTGGIVTAGIPVDTAKPRAKVLTEKPRIKTGSEEKPESLNLNLVSEEDKPGLKSNFRDVPESEPIESILSSFEQDDEDRNPEEDRPMTGTAEGRLGLQNIEQLNKDTAEYYAKLGSRGKTTSAFSDGHDEVRK